jgi:hypothetical protein
VAAGAFVAGAPVFVLLPHPVNMAADTANTARPVTKYTFFMTKILQTIRFFFLLFMFFMRFLFFCCFAVSCKPQLSSKTGFHFRYDSAEGRDRKKLFTHGISRGFHARRKRAF